ncbi:aminoacyl-tRNA deacylase [Porphyromonas gingivalis]|nr:aminoacyl-tRNA deacylase [Porphyromonas gingivalis]
MPKTNVARLLDAAHITYELIPYEPDERDLSAVHVAEQLGEDVRQVFKTLVLRGNKTGLLVCIVPGNEEVDLKLAARASDNKSVEMIRQSELLPLTGYIRGGCSPIGMKKAYPSYIHHTCMAFPYICQRGRARFTASDSTGRSPGIHGSRTGLPLRCYDRRKINHKSNPIIKHEQKNLYCVHGCRLHHARFQG